MLAEQGAGRESRLSRKWTLSEGYVPFPATSTLGLPLSFQGAYLQGFRQLTTLDSELTPGQPPCVALYIGAAALHFFLHDGPLA